ncbi:MAG TPA: DUF4367 domain-containing protein [Candidatus Saccharimonadales bacterium]|nr:DUF4367 domain-containing protein [Candidatus Saccharimonadales bacterium]
MRGQNTIVINGKVYDAVTGLAVGAPDPVAPAPKPIAVKPNTGQSLSGIQKSTRGRQLVRKAQKSQTLKRQHLKKPASHQTPIHHATVPHTRQSVSRSTMISKFAPATIHRPAPAKTEPEDKLVVSRLPHHVARASRQPDVRPVTKLSSSELKRSLIAKRLAEVDTKAQPAEVKPARKKGLTAMPVVSGAIALILLAGYLTYLNMPELSVRVAAAQSNVAATYPGYRPDGYHLDGPVAYQPGEVQLDFKANDGTAAFTIAQHNSTWDSQAVYDNYVAKQDQAYQINTRQGITIYTYGNNAAWVNGGVFYTISGSAPLSSDQLLHIATSM